MRTRRILLICGTGALLAATAIAASGGSAIASRGHDPVASAAKKKCKKKRGRSAQSARKKKCKRRGGGALYLEGRYSGTYAENNVNLFFNVVGGRVYTGPLDAFYLDAQCGGRYGGTDATAYEPVQATISPNGDFSGSGVYNTGYTQQPWTLSGHIAGGTITGGTFSSGYANTYGDPCSGTTHFTAQWYGAYTL